LKEAMLRAAASDAESARLSEELAKVKASAVELLANVNELARRNTDLEARITTAEAARQSDLPEVQRLKQAKEDAENILKQRMDEAAAARRSLEAHVASLEHASASLAQRCERLKSAAVGDREHAAMMRSALDESTKELATLRAESLAADARRDHAAKVAKDEAWHLQQLLNDEMLRNEAIPELQRELAESHSKADRLAALLRDVEGTTAAVTTLKWRVVTAQNREARQSALTAKLRRKIISLEQRAAEADADIAKLRSTAVPAAPMVKVRACTSLRWFSCPFESHHP